MRLYKREAQISNLARLTYPVVIGHVRRSIDKISLLLMICLFRYRAMTDKVCVIFRARETCRCFVWPHVARRHPDNQDILTANLSYLSNRIIVRQYLITQANKLFLYLIELSALETNRRQNRYAVFLAHSHNDIATAPVVDIVRKRTNRLHYIEWVPPRLKLQSFPLDRSSS